MDLGRKIKNLYFLELPFKLLYMLFAIFTYCNITLGRPVMSVVVNAVLLVGAGTMLLRLVNLKGYIKTPGLLFAVIFIFSSFVSLVMNTKYGFSDGFKGLVWMGFHFFAFFACDINRDTEAYKKEFKVISWFFTACMFVLSFMSLLQFFTGYTVIEYTPGKPAYLAGFVWGRLWGMFYDPNYGSVYAAVAIVFSLYYIKNIKKLAVRIALIFNITVQFMYISFSDSRTGLVTVFCCMFAFAYLIAVKKIKLKKIMLQLVAIALAVVIGAASAVIPVAIKDVNNMLQAPGQDITVTPGDEGGDGEIDTTIGRGGELEEDISNRRFDIWMSGVEIFETSPIFGVSFFNLMKYAEAELPETYLVNNDHGKFGNMHNMFFNVLAGQGVIGTAALLAFAVYMIIYILRRIFKVEGEDYGYLAVLLTCVVAGFSSSMFLTDLIYVNSPTSVMFWLFLGYIVHYLKKSDAVKKIN